MGEHPGNTRNRVFCSSCGAMAARRGGVAPLAWQEMPNQGRSIALCPECVRASLWMIEARLDIDPELGP